MSTANSPLAQRDNRTLSVVQPLPSIVIVGAGFGGLKAAKALGRAHARVTVIDRSNHHTFQPLLYQVATAGLSPADIAQPIRSILRSQENTEVIMDEVTGIDTQRKRVLLGDGKAVPYDYLIIATGARHSYFGKDDWEKNAPGLKSIDDATEIRKRILLAFEAAEIETDPELRKAWLNFVIVGAGPTGCELAGSIAELANVGLTRDFRHIRSSDARVFLIEAGPRILASFPESLSKSAHKALEKLGVEVHVNERVEQVDDQGVTFVGKRLPSKTVIWAAGVRASSAAQWLGAEADRAGRVKVKPNLTVEGHPEIFVIGDTAAAVDSKGRPLPGVAPVAMQQGRYVASVIKRRLNGAKEDRVFRYIDKGNLATIGRAYAIADIHNFKLKGFVAWMTWLFVHIFYLIGFRNKIIVLIQWIWAYLTFQRGARLITKENK